MATSYNMAGTTQGMRAPSNLLGMENWGMPQAPYAVDGMGFNPSGQTNSMYQPSPALDTYQGLGSWGSGGSGGNPLTSAASTASPSVMDLAFGYTGNDQMKHAGMAQPVMNLAGGLMQGYLGMKTLSLGRDNLNNQKEEFAKNWGAQKTLTNARLQDQQANRAAANPLSFGNKQAVQVA
jgi:hypothetical protein